MKEDKGPQFVYSDNEQTILCRRPLKFEVVVSHSPHQRSYFEVEMRDPRGFYFNYNQHENKKLQQSILTRMADWYYYTVIKKENERGPDKQTI